MWYCDAGLLAYPVHSHIGLYLHYTFSLKEQENIKRLTSRKKGMTDQE